MAKSIKKDLSKVNKLLHPKSRKVAKLHGKAERIESREKVKKRHQMKENLIGEKLMWFKERLEPDTTVYTKEMLLNVIEEYLARFSDELEQINIVHSMKHRQRRYASREDTIKNTIKQEELEFTTCGFEVPDLLNPQMVKQLREWNGELRFLPNFRWRRYTRKFLSTVSKSEKKKTNKSEVNSDKSDKDEDEGEMEQAEEEVDEERGKEEGVDEEKEEEDDDDEEREVEEEETEGEDEKEEESSAVIRNAGKARKVNRTDPDDGESMEVDN